MRSEQQKLHGKRWAAFGHFLRVGWLPLLTVAACVGCKPDPTGAPADPVGTYTLVSVNGKPIPCEVEHENAMLKVASGTFDIGADGTCRSKVTFSLPGGNEVTRDVTATYTRAGDQLTMRWQRAGITKGVVQGDQFTMTNEGMIFAYRK